MKLFLLDERQCLPISLDEAWSFFSDPENLEEITPPSLQLRITSETPNRMYEGMIITYRVSPFMGVSVNWVTEITSIDKPHLFIDEQRLGPYRFWQHQHHFREIEGGVELRDLVHYSLYMSPLDRIINTMMVKNRLHEIFSYRRHYLENRFGRIETGSND